MRSSCRSADSDMISAAVKGCRLQAGSFTLVADRAQELRHWLRRLCLFVFAAMVLDVLVRLHQSINSPGTETQPSTPSGSSGVFC